MHTLHRPHLSRVTTVTVIAAFLAIVLTLAVAAGLNDLASTTVPTGRAGTTLQASPTGHAWNVNPFESLLSAPAPWAPALL